MAAAKWNGRESPIRCPFTGRPLKLCQVGPNWVAASEGPGGGFVTSLFPSEKELLKFLHAFAKEIKPGMPVDKPLLECPWLELPFQIAEVSGRGWVASVCDLKGRGYSTSSFWSRRHLEYFLSTRAGVPPLFRNGDIEVRERVALPPDPIGEEEASRQEAVHAATDEVVDKVGFETGALRPRVRLTGAAVKRG